jgi:alpha-tubulin suppressor-like RCC1 family protein
VWRSWRYSSRSLARVLLLGAFGLSNLAHAGPLGGIVQIAVGSLHTCALTSAGAVKCWGSNGFGQVGDGSTTDRAEPRAVVGLGSGVVAIAAGGHSCALLVTGEVQCWGQNFLGQLGDGTRDDRATPVLVTGLSSVTAIAAGINHTCAVTSMGAVKCWGSNDHGQLGDNTQPGPFVPTYRTTPVDVVGLSSGVAQIAAGYQHTCAVTIGGSVKCWGGNSWGEVGDPADSSDHRVPFDAPGIGLAVASVAAGNLRTCVITTSGAAKCWGGSDVVFQPPTDVPGLGPGVISIAAGNHMCAVTSSNAAKCWGTNQQAQLGDGTTVDRATPVGVLGLSTTAARIDTGLRHTCAVTTAGNVMCWGENSFGQLGIGVLSNVEATPVFVPDLLLQTIDFEMPPAVELANGSMPLNATASSGLPVTFSHSPNPPYTCAISGNQLTLLAIGFCSVTASMAGNSTYAAAEVVRNIRITGAKRGDPPRLVGISTRAAVGTGEDVVIAGFAIGGDSGLQKVVLIRARGPSLAAAGVANTLSNPRLELYKGPYSETFNDDWRVPPYADLIASVDLAPSNDFESAMLVPLVSGPYTAILDGVAQGTGVAIVEVVEIDNAARPLVGISTRGRVSTQDDVMIGGFVIEGSFPQTVIVRARGPSLGPAGVAGFLPNPMLQLVRSSDQGLIATNDDWGKAANAPDISASGYAPASPLESAILITLQPGAYTAIVSGSGGTTGVGIIEVYAQ